MHEKLIKSLTKYFDIGDSYAYNLTRDKRAFMCGTMGFDDFEEFDDETVSDIADYLIADGVLAPPCKVGDRLYTLCCRGTGDWFIHESIVSKIEISEDSGMQITERRKGALGEYFYYQIDPDQIGKSIFLTKEEAEEALARRRGDE